MMKKLSTLMLIFILLLTCLYTAAVYADSGKTLDKSAVAVVKVAAGGAGNAVLRKDGTVWCFGVGKHGELGDGGMKNYSGPVKVKGLEDVVDIDASFGITIALKQDGTVWGWGNNDVMELAVPLSYFDNTQNIRVNIEVKHIKDKEECITYDEIPGWFDAAAE